MQFSSEFVHRNFCCCRTSGVRRRRRNTHHDDGMGGLALEVERGNEEVKIGVWSKSEGFQVELI